jgi:hypothetical protein
LRGNTHLHHYWKFNLIDNSSHINYHQPYEIKKLSQGASCMLKALPKNWFSSTYLLFEHDKPISSFAMSYFSESTNIQVDNESYKASRASLFSGDFSLRSAGGVLVRAVKPSVWSRSFDIEYDNRKYTLTAEKPVYRKFILWEDNKMIGSIYPDHAFTVKASIDLPENIPLAVRIFMFWLVAILWKRDTDSSATGAIVAIFSAAFIAGS